MVWDGSFQGSRYGKSRCPEAKVREVSDSNTLAAYLELGWPLEKAFFHPWPLRGVATVVVVADTEVDREAFVEETLRREVDPILLVEVAAVERLDMAEELDEMDRTAFQTSEESDLVGTEDQ